MKCLLLIGFLGTLHSTIAQQDTGRALQNAVNDQRLPGRLHSLHGQRTARGILDFLKDTTGILIEVAEYTPPGAVAGNIVGFGDCGSTICITPDVVGRDAVKCYKAISREPKIIKGKITKVQWHDEWPLVNGKDLNVFIQPDPEYGGVLINRNGSTNKNGLLEGEVMALDYYLDRLFPAGSNVIAKGWWVEDHGHCGKTEFHPLISLLGPTYAPISGQVPLYENAFNYYLAADNSNRFYYAPPKNERLLIRLDPFTDERDVARYQGGKDNISFVNESSLLDESILPGTPIASSLHTTFFTDYREDEKLAIEVSLKKRYLATPYYVAQYNRSVESNFEDNISYERVERSGAPAIKITIRPAIKNISGGQIYFKFDAADRIYSAVDVYDRPVSINYSPGLKQAQDELVVYYSPLNGETNTRWTLSVRGKMQLEKFATPPTRQQGSSYFERNATLFRYFNKKRTYFLTPSTIALEREYKLQDEKPVIFINSRIELLKHAKLKDSSFCWLFEAENNSAPAGGSVGTPYSQVVDNRAGILQLNFEQSKSFRTLIDEVRSATQLKPGQMIDKGDYIVRASLSEPYQLAIEWKVARKEFIPKYRFKVNAYARTDLGEHLRTVSEFTDTHVSIHVNDILFDEFIRGILIVSSMGVDVPITPEWAMQNKRRLNSLSPVPLFKEGWNINRYTGKNKESLNVFQKMNNQERLTVDDELLVRELIKIGSNGKWASGINNDVLQSYKKMILFNLSK